MARRSKEAQAAYFRKWYNRQVWPKCDDCGFIARRFPDIGCLECFAKSQPRREYTDPENELIEINAGKDDLPNLQYRIYQDTGIARTRSSIDARQERMGIKVKEHQDGFTIAQLSELTGVNENTVTYRMNRLGIKNQGRGRIVLVSLEDGQRLIDYYKRDPRPSYSLDEAMQILGVQESGIYVALRAGLPSWKDGHYRRVCKATIDRAVAYLRETGKVRVPWRLIVSR